MNSTLKNNTNQKNLLKKAWVTLLFLLFITCTTTISANPIATIKSPDETIEVKLLLDNSILYYQVDKSSQNIIARSKLRINTSLADFTSGLTFKEVTSDYINENYSLPSGKKSTYTNNYNQVKATFSKADNDLTVIIRVYDDGLACQYHLEGTGNLTIYSEASQCNISYKDQIYSQVYSRDYKNIIEVSDYERESCLKRTSLPLLVKTGDNYVLISEAMVNGSYSASRLLADEQTQGFQYDITGTINTQLPFQSPWRTMMTGSLTTIVSSTMMENLNAPTTLTDLSWIKPGRAAWNYGGEDTSGYLAMDNIRKYIDWAEEMGWEYFTLDRGWQNNTNIDLNEVLNYARSKNIGLFIWVNQHTLPTDKAQLRNTLRNWRNAGVKGLKVDFWESDSQEMMQKYDLLLEIAAEQKLLLNFQSCTKPTGLRRTWPHLLTTEAVLSNTYYAASPNVITSVHNINNAIIRTPLGATDYTPVDFADKNGKIHYGTTHAHQLALSVIYESGIQHINDSPENIRYNITNNFLKTLPAGWDDTKCLEAEMEKHITIARNKGEDWYIASITNEARTWETDLSFLAPNITYNAYIYKDGGCPSEILFEYRENISYTDRISLPVKPNGGFAIILSPSANYEKPLHATYEAESSDNAIPFGVAVKTDTDSLCSNGKYVAGIGKGRALIFQKIKVPQSGTYALTFYYTAKINQSAYIKINDKAESWKEFTFAGTGNESGSGLGHKTILVDLEATHKNTIEYGNYNDIAPNLDRIVISTYGSSSTNTPQVKEDNKYGNIYTLNKQIVIAQDSFTTYQIYNSLGQLLHNGVFNGGSISIPVTNTGVYLVKISTNNCDHTQKVIVK